MCGVTGFLNRGALQTEENLHGLAHQMNETILHRGPDAGDIWVDPQAQVALAHRRLSIQDLSPAGAQPMASHCGRYVMVYNGEVYNKTEIMAGLSRNWRGHSDTEAILESFAQRGLEATLQKLIGMFVIALWDKEENTLYLVRDRLGIKPLYWGLHNNVFMFGSELKALCAHPAFKKDIDRNALASFMRHNYVPGPYSIYQNVEKLQPGYYLTLRHGQAPVTQPYWQLEEVIDKAGTWQGSPQEAVDALDDLLSDAVNQRLLSDVPLGAFLSGGVDSSTVAALMQKNASSPVRTFSIGFHEEGYNEAQHAAAVARHLGTDHTELYVSPEEARSVIPQMADYYDEPFSDSSQIPTFLLSQMTKKHVTVALSGDGGDELFCGYTRYFTARKYGNLIFNQPRLLRQLASSTIGMLSPQTWDRLGAIIPESKRPTLLGDKLYKLAGVLSGDRNDFYRRLISHWEDPDTLVRDGAEYKGLVWQDKSHHCDSDFTDHMQYLDTKTYLPDDILTKVDRASMAVALEARVPLLDHRVVEFAWQLPQNLKFRDSQGKWVLRQVLNRYIPLEMIDRPKMGFGVPIDDWLRGPLKEWASDLLCEDEINKHGLLNPAPVQEKWQEHLSGKRNWQYHLWDILMLQSWCNRWGAS